MLSNVNVFEHNESMNIMNISLFLKSEVRGQQVKYQKGKSILFLLFFLWSSEKAEIPFCFNQNSQGITYASVSFLIKFAGQPATLLKKRL